MSELKVNINDLYFIVQTVNQVPKAVQALTTHRRIEPKNEIARMNAAYMKQLPGITQKNFVEREVKEMPFVHY